MRAMEINATLVTEDFETAAALLELFSKYVAEHHELSRVMVQAHEIEVSHGHAAEEPEPEPAAPDDPERLLDGPDNVALEEDG